MIYTVNGSILDFLYQLLTPSPSFPPGTCGNDGGMPDRKSCFLMVPPGLLVTMLCVVTHNWTLSRPISRPTVQASRQVCNQGPLHSAEGLQHWAMASRIGSLPFPCVLPLMLRCPCVLQHLLGSNLLVCGLLDTHRRR